MTVPLIRMQETTRHILVHVLTLLIFTPPQRTDSSHSVPQVLLPLYLTVPFRELHLEESQCIFIVPEDPGTVFTCTSAMTRDTVVRAPLGLMLLLLLGIMSSR